MKTPSQYLEINLLLDELFKSVQTIFGAHLAGMYLDGSLASGDFDQDSDIDFVVVTEEDINPAQFAALQAMHDRLAGLDTPWAIQLEGFYLSRPALRRHDPQGGEVPNIERGCGERLKMVPLGPDWDIHRYILRKNGIILAGPAPEALIDPVAPGQLRQAVRFILSEWVAPLVDHPEQLGQRGYQSYIVLSLCRMLYTLEEGEIGSKRAAGRWAQQALGERWAKLIESAWEGRHNPDQPLSGEELEQTRAFMRYVIGRGAG